MARSAYVTAAAVLLALLSAPAAEAASSRRGLAQASATTAHSKGKKGKSGGECVPAWPGVGTRQVSLVVPIIELHTRCFIGVGYPPPAAHCAPAKLTRVLPNSQLPSSPMNRTGPPGPPGPPGPDGPVGPPG